METGEVKVLELVSAHDIGRAIHPAICERSNGGGTARFGMALTEEIYFDVDGNKKQQLYGITKMLGSSDMPKNDQYPG